MHVVYDRDGVIALLLGTQPHTTGDRKDDNDKSTAQDRHKERNARIFRIPLGDVIACRTDKVQKDQRRNAKCCIELRGRQFPEESYHGQIHGSMARHIRLSEERWKLADQNS